MDETDVLDLVDTIYGCAAGQHEWPSFLKQFSSRFPGLKPAIAGYDSQFSELNVWLIEGIPDDAVRDYAEYYYRLNPWAECLKAAPMAPEVHWAHDYISTDEILRTEFYNDYVRHQDDAVGGFATTLVREPDRFLTFHGNFNFKYIDEATQAIRYARQIGPHLARAFELYRRLGVVSLYANALEDALNRLTNAVFIVDGELRLEFANKPAQEILRTGLVLRSKAPRQLLFNSPADERNVRSQLNALENISGPIPATYFRLQLPPERPLVGFVSRLNLGDESAIARTKGAILPRRLYALFLISPKERIEADVDTICALLGVTRAEARLAQALINGVTLQEYARKAHISYHTVRSHMKSLIAKTEATNQADLIQSLTKIFCR